MNPENPEGTRVIAGSMNSEICIRHCQETNNLFHPKCASIPLGLWGSVPHNYENVKRTIRPTTQASYSRRRVQPNKINLGSIHAHNIISLLTSDEFNVIVYLGQLFRSLVDTRKGIRLCSICRGVGGLTLPLVPLNPPSLYWPPEKIVKISQKYIADPLWFTHKSSTAWHPVTETQFNTQY